MKTKKNLIIDCQVFQTEAWHRGMGKYSLGLLGALVHDGFTDKYDSVQLLINENVPYGAEPAKVLKKLLPEAKIIKTKLVVPSPGKNQIAELRTTNKNILDQEITARGIANPEFLILSLFLDEVCVVFPDSTKKLLVFYDLIPFLYYERYKNRINFEGYLDHFQTIFEADCIFNISQTVANDNHVYLGIDRSKLVTIDGASIDRSVIPSVKPGLELPQKFILMPSGDELRKNNLRAVKGFEEFNARHENEYKLIITSRFGDYTKQELSTYSDNLLFTGNIKEEELQWLYENAHCVLFASEYEGLGLPILEAMSVGKQIACSNIPVFREISSSAFYIFDEFDPVSIAQTLSEVCEDVNWREKTDQYEKILQNYTWEQTAKKFSKGYENVFKAKKIDHKSVEAVKPKIAVLAPHPAGYSAIGKVVAESHAAYSELFDVDYYFDFGPFHRIVRPDYLSHIANCYDAAYFNAQEYKKYDAVIYHVGNSDYHLDTIKNALHLPGYAILHDTYLDGAFETLKNANYISADRMTAEEMLNKQGPPTGRFLTSVLNNQLGVITHSKYAADVARACLEEPVPVVEVALPVSTPKAERSSNQTVQIGLAGIIADVKGLSIVEDLVISGNFTDCTINIFGHSFAKPEIMQQFSRWPNVKVHPNPSDFEFQSKLSGLDLLINYRLEYRGETSLTTLEAMRYGVPVIVRDTGWYSELPDDAVVKCSDEPMVIEQVEMFKTNKKLRDEVGRKAARYTDVHHNHHEYAKGLEQTLHTSTSSRPSKLVLSLRQAETAKDVAVRSPELF